MIRNVCSDVFQVGECVAGAAGHEAVQVYVLMNAGRPILVDCGSQLHRAGLMAALTELLAGQPVDTVLLTHSELPHAGNLRQVAERWPGVRVIVSNVMLPYIEITPALPLERVATLKAGASLMVAGRQLEFVDALLKDQPGSQWINDPVTGTLFTGEGFGYLHSAEQCGQFSDEVAGGLSVEAFQVYHRTAFRFLRWVIADRLNADLDRMFERYAVRNIAPIHGHALRGDVPAHVARLKQALAGACADLREGGL